MVLNSDKHNLQVFDFLTSSRTIEYYTEPIILIQIKMNNCFNEFIKDLYLKQIKI